MGVNTPALPGYLLAYAAACAVAPVALLAAESVGQTGAYGDVFGYLAVLTIYEPLGTAFCLLAGIPLGAVGGAMVHLVCRRIAAQWVHVAVTAAAGAVGGLLYGVPVLHAIGSDLGSAYVVVALTVAAAAGRAAVIPVVQSRRRRLAPETVLRVP
jgi:hypothetical protein